MKIKSYNSFSESLLSKLSDKISNIIPLSFFKSDRNSSLKKYDISIKKISDISCQFIHDSKVISELNVSADAIPFKLTIYFYESEIKNTDGSKLKTNFSNQDEQPYAKGSKKFYTQESAVDYLVWWWSNKTKSGIDKNPSIKLKF